MEDQVITTTQSTEPIVIESANTSAENTAGLSQVIDQATPMDSNTTYSNLPKVEYQPNMSPTQNLINEAVQTEHAINQESNAGKAMNSFLTQGYDYDKNEAGSYWVAGAINDNNTQMSFLQTLINEEMYDEMDLQKYYYDTNLATARAYAAQKGKETAYGFYRAAQERALAEGELTGWYMPAEGRYLLGQYTVAQNTLENPDATPEEISKANRVAKAAESWFSANQITTRGIKCLAMMNYEENVRHNTVMGELQKQANAIAAQGAAASAASAGLALREKLFQLEEMELARGQNYTKMLGLDNNDRIGHQVDYKYQALQGFDSVKDALMDHEIYAAVLGARGKGFVDAALAKEGVSAEQRLAQYEWARQGSIINSEEFAANGYKLKEEDMTKQKYQTKDKEDIYTFQNRAYKKDKNGNFTQITEDIKLKDGSKLSDKLKYFSTDSLKTNDGVEVQIGNTHKYSITNSSDKFGLDDDSRSGVKKMGSDTIKVMEEYEAKGYVWVSGKFSTDKINAGVVMYNPEEDKYIEISDIYGDVKEVKADKLDNVDEGINWDKDKGFTVNTSWDDGKRHEYLLQHSRYIGEKDAKKNEDDFGIYKKDVKVPVYMFTDSNDEVHYFYQDPNNYDMYIIIDEKEASKINPNVSTKATEYAQYKSGKVDTTTKIEKTKAKEYPTTSTSTTVTGDTSSAGGGSTTYDPEKREAVFKKYNVSAMERQEYKDIKDPEELEKKLNDRYKDILGMGGDQNGK